MKIKSLIMLYCLMLLTGCGTMAAFHCKYRNLNNPTSYSFHSEEGRVLKVIKGMDGYRLTSEANVYALQEWGIGIMILPHYSSDYWNGVHEEDVEYPEAGKIGQIQGKYEIKVTKNGDQTLVTVDAAKLFQQTGRKNVIFPDFKTVGVFKKVPSDTYYEYLFLHKLGELLGETGMPEIKSE